mgnify:CR=1 FL=1
MFKLKLSTKPLKRVLGDPQAATIKRLRKRVKEINAVADEYKKLSDTKLKANSVSIVGYSTVNLNGQDYKVGEVIDINGKRGRILADGSIVELN